MKTSSLFLVASMMFSILAFADADDTQWIAQCLMDNKDEGAPTEVVQKYCGCMNNTVSQ